MSRNRGLLFPLALIAIGVIVLLANTGVLTQGALERLGDLWPLLLVIFGLQLILNHTLPRPQATMVGLAAGAVIVIAALVYATLAPAASFGTKQADSSHQLAGLTAATLDLSYSGASVEVQAGSLSDSLYQAHIDYPGNEDPPTITVDSQSGRLEIRQEASFSPLRLFHSGRRHILVTLTDRIPWTVQIGGGAAALRLDLRRLQLTTLEISGGANRADAQLPGPKATVRIAVSGGASNLTLRAPKDSEWRVKASGGASAVSINGSTFGGVGEFQRQSPGYASATNRFDIEISGGASHIDFKTG
jgi:cell wall-active antibiotic response 4TMS protein YvqF